MTEIRVDNPHKVFVEDVKDKGRITLGREFDGKQVRVVVEVLDGCPSDDDE